MADSWKDMTAADVHARNARIGNSWHTPSVGTSNKIATHPDINFTPTPMPPKTSKYKNARTKIGTEVFDSQREARYWLVLMARQQEGDIFDLHRQEEFPLYCPSAWQNGESETQVSTYVADFVYTDRDHKLHVLDAKGVRTQVYKLKKKWMELQNGITIEEV